MQNRPIFRLPLSAWLLGVPGLVCLAAALTLIIGDFSAAHPVLAEAGTAIVLAVSALALLGSAAFPALLQHLASRDTPAQ